MKNLQLFNFQIKRIFKNKNFIWFTLFTLLIILFLNLLIFFLVEIELIAAQINLLINVSLSLVWLAFININGVVNVVIKEEKTGIQGLEIRRGIKPSEIFIYKFGALKIITTAYIFILYLYFIILTLCFGMASEKFIISNLAIGLLSLFVFDIIIFSIAIFICVFSKSNKKTISISWSLSIFMLLSPILGPLGFSFSGANVSSGSDGINYIITERNSRIKEITELKSDSFTYKIIEDKKILKIL